MKARAISLTDEAWAGLQSLAQQRSISISNLLEMLGSGKFRVWIPPEYVVRAQQGLEKRPYGKGKRVHSVYVSDSAWLDLLAQARAVHTDLSNFVEKVGIGEWSITEII